jgi:hypothetical protein
MIGWTWEPVLSEHIRRQNALSGKGFGFSGLYTSEGRWVYDWLRFEKIGWRVDCAAIQEGPLRKAADTRSTMAT